MRRLPVFRSDHCHRFYAYIPPFSIHCKRNPSTRRLPVLGVRMTRAENLAHQFWLALENAHWRRQHAWWLNAPVVSVRLEWWAPGHGPRE